MDLGVLEGQTRGDYFLNSIFDPSVKQCSVQCIVQYTYPQDPDTQTLRLQGVLHSTEGAPNFCYKVNAEQYFTDVTLALMEN